MTGNMKPAARDTAGSIEDAQAPLATARLASLRTLADVVSLGANEAPVRESRERLHAAAAAIFDAHAIERRALQCGKRA
jgi:hypothetical protein